jgi:hypothetical protein
MRSHCTDRARIQQEGHESPTIHRERHIYHRRGHIELHVRPKRQRRDGRSEVMTRLLSSGDGRAATDVMADVAPAELSLSHLTFVVPVHRLVQETTKRQIKARCRVSVFLGQVH